jgi:hypothetical protein
MILAGKNRSSWKGTSLGKQEGGDNIKMDIKYGMA